MANPQTEDGFVMVALDLFPAILSAGLSSYAQIILSEVLLQWAGPKKKDRVTLVPSEMARRTGLDRNNARRAIRELVEANILRADEDGESFRFNKDYDSWAPKGSPLETRLNGAMTRWIKGSVERHGVGRKDKRSSKSGESTQTQIQTSERVYPDSPTSVGASSPRLTDNRLTESGQTHPHIEERTRDEIGEGRKEEWRAGEGAPAPAARSPVDLDPEYTEVGEKAIELSGDFSWGSWVSNRGREGHPAKLILQAIQEADGSGNLAKPYVLKILRRCAREGITDLNPAPARAAPKGQAVEVEGGIVRCRGGVMNDPAIRAWAMGET